MTCGAISMILIMNRREVGGKEKDWENKSKF